MTTRRKISTIRSIWQYLCFVWPGKPRPYSIYNGIFSFIRIVIPTETMLRISECSIKYTWIMPSVSNFAESKATRRVVEGLPLWSPDILLQLSTLNCRLLFFLKSFSIVLLAAKRTKSPGTGQNSHSLLKSPVCHKPLSFNSRGQNNSLFTQMQLRSTPSLKHILSFFLNLNGGLFSFATVPDFL